MVSILRGLDFLVTARYHACVLSMAAQEARGLLACTDYTVCALVRAADAARTAHRLPRAWWDWPELSGAIGNCLGPPSGKPPSSGKPHPQV